MKRLKILSLSVLFLVGVLTTGYGAQGASKDHDVGYKQPVKTEIVKAPAYHAPIDFVNIEVAAVKITTPEVTKVQHNYSQDYSMITDEPEYYRSPWRLYCLQCYSDNYSASISEVFTPINYIPKGTMASNKPCSIRRL